MFWIKKLVLENFGAYYGHHELEFQDKKGVTLIWGVNGYGKTTITNAFRYVLWGKILGRKRRELPAKSFVNTDAEKEGGSMYVELYLQVDGDDYLVRRGLNRTDLFENYENVFQVNKCGVIMSYDEASEWLENLLPWNISRFYLFDGELLGEYEDLLDEDNDLGEKIKTSIEDILGVPVLIRARTALKSLVDEANAEVTKQAEKENTTKELANNKAEAEEKLEQLKKSRSELQKELEKEEKKQGEILDKMKESAQLREYINSREDKKNTINILEKKCETKKEELGIYLEKLWETEMSFLISDTICILSNSIATLKEKKKKSLHIEYVGKFVQEHLCYDPTHCPICGIEHDAYSLKAVIEKFNNFNGVLLSPEQEEKLNTVSKNISELSTLLKETNDLNIIKSLYADITETENDCIFKKTELKDIEEKLIKIDGGDFDIEKELAELPEKYEKSIKKIGTIKIGLKDNEDDITVAEGAIQKMNEAIKKTQIGTGTETALRKLEFVKNIYAIFSESIDLFRDKVMKNVERDASESFVKISHQEEFSGLKMNNNFGLEIVKKGGEIVPNRSSGYEQVVAISLISALHKNAPIAGPVFLDSTFQRVDTVHKKNTLKNLSDISDQIIILAYPNEIGDDDEVRNTLGEKLIKEVRLAQITSSKSYFE